MPPGDCFRCHQPGHWANNCPLKTPTKPISVADAVVSPPVIYCPCNGNACIVLTSNTKKNPNRRFYNCSAVPSCGFFKWCDQVSINKSEPVAVCSIKKNFGASGFFQWEYDAKIPQEAGNSSVDSVDDVNLLHETDLDSDGNVIKSRLGNRVVDGITLTNESIPVFGGFNNRKQVSNGRFASADVLLGTVPSFDLIRGYEDTEEVSSFASKNLEPQVETLCTDLLEFNYVPEDIPEQYNTEKLHFESVSMKHVDVLTAYKGSCKQLESLRDKANGLKKELHEVETHVKLYEAETLEFAASLQEVFDEMAKSQKKMVELAGKIGKEVKS